MSKNWVEWKEKYKEELKARDPSWAERDYEEWTEKQYFFERYKSKIGVKSIQAFVESKGIQEDEVIDYCSKMSDAEKRSILKYTEYLSQSTSYVVKTKDVFLFEVLYDMLVNYLENSPVDEDDKYIYNGDCGQYIAGIKVYPAGYSIVIDDLIFDFDMGYYDAGGNSRGLNYEDSKYLDKKLKDIEDRYPTSWGYKRAQEEMFSTAMNSISQSIDSKELIKFFGISDTKKKIRSI